VPADKTAFVVVDMQNYFMAPGQQVEIPAVLRFRLMVQRGPWSRPQASEGDGTPHPW
jgi:nicotinamidase-related amidase